MCEVKKCSKCDRLLPISDEYFLKDKLCLDGHRNVCKECAGGSFGYRPKQKWTTEDDNVLIDNYPFMSNKDLINTYFPNRSVSKLSDHAIKSLKLHKDEEYIKYRTWSKEQIDFLDKNYSAMNNKELAEILDKNEAIVLAKAVGLGLKKDIWWSKDEEDILINNYPFMKTEDMVSLYFLERGFGSVNNKVRSLNLKKDEEYLYNIQTETGLNNLKRIPNQEQENNPRWVGRVEIKCDQCGKDIKLTPLNSQNQDNYFCSYNCMGKWKSEHWRGENNPSYGRGDEIWTSEMRKDAAKRAVETLKKLNFSQNPTKPQLIINNLLDYNLMIEVQGNFFHCNPVMNLANSRKSKIINKDKSKHTYIKKYHDIDVLYLWEKDIINDLDKCEKLITQYIIHNGILDNYHSFNYCIGQKDELHILDELYVIGY